jgi:small subunit ribosomal protein S1
LTELHDLLDQHDYDSPQVGDIRQGIIVSINTQGVIVDLGLKRDGLVPTSDLNKLEPEERDALKVNDEVFVYVLNTDKPDSLVISIHLARLNQDWIRAEELLGNEEIIEAEVIGYNKGGAIVPFGRLRGFVPISHLTDINPGMGDRRRQQQLAKLRGETLPLRVIEVNRRRRRLVLSQREAQKEWDSKRRAELIDKLEVGEIRRGTVSGIRDFGAFIDLGGADGLIHISELAWHRVEHPREVLKVGEEIDVYVMRVDEDNQRISLSLKKILPNPWDTVSERYYENQLVEGTITRIVDYGAFAEIEPGVEGLLHVSQLSRGTVSNVNELVQEGETHLLRIVNIDQNRQRIGLSLKAVTAMEQIEWMAQREIEKAAAEAAAEAVAAAAAAEAEAAKKAAEEAVEAAEEAVEEAEVATTEAEAAVGVTGEEAEVADEAAELAEDMAEEAVEAAEATVAAAEVAEVAAEVAEEAVEAVKAADTLEEAEETAEVADKAKTMAEAMTEEAEEAADAAEAAEEIAEVAAEVAEEAETAAAGELDEEVDTDATAEMETALQAKPGAESKTEEDE